MPRRLSEMSIGDAQDNLIKCLVDCKQAEAELANREARLFDAATTLLTVASDLAAHGARVSIDPFILRALDNCNGLIGSQARREVDHGVS